jgi:hypothetical protein
MDDAEKALRLTKQPDTLAPGESSSAISEGAQEPSYRNPSAKAPVIHSEDEAPYLVWGAEGSAQRRLTEGVRPAMIGIDVLL